MQLSEQQFYILLATVPALITAILVYALTAYVQQRQRRKMQQSIAETGQQLKEREQDLHQFSTDLALKQQKIDGLNEALLELRQRGEQLQHKNESLTQQLHQEQTRMETMQVEQVKERQYTEEKLQQLEHNRTQLKQDFQRLAEEVLPSELTGFCR